jgi:hypothetical protein
VLLNLGCGDRYAQGWVNVDFGSPHRKDREIDLIGELPWEHDSILHVYMGHVLEHLTPAQATVLLERLYPLVRPEGQIMIVGPDVKLAEKLQAQGYVLEVPLEHLRHGAGRWAGDEHMWECTAAGLTRLLRTSGWKSIENVGIENVAEFWPVAVRGPKWQCAVSARSKR